MPRCGKSSFCTEWAKEKPNRVIVCSDDIRLALHGQRYEPLAETMVFAIKHIMIRAHIARGSTVIVDGTHSTEVSIQRLLEIDRGAVAITFDTPMEECIRRANATGQMDLVGPIQRINQQIQKIHEVGLQEYMARICENIDRRGLF